MRKFFINRVISFFVVLAVILLLIFFGRQGWLAMPQNIVFKISAPVIKIFQWGGDKISSSLSVLFTLKDLAQENTKLKEEAKQLWQENSFLKETARENEILRQRLMLPQVLRKMVVLAGVVGQNPEAEQVVLVDKGTNDGLRVGLAVVTANDFLVGQVVEVNSSFAKVVLINSSDSSINALTQETRVSGAVKGSHGLEVAMEMIPVDAQIKNDETVLTSGLNEIIPGGLIVGQIKSVVKKESDIWQRAVIEPAADLKKLEQVFIVLP